MMPIPTGVIRKTGLRSTGSCAQDPAHPVAMGTQLTLSSNLGTDGPKYNRNGMAHTSAEYRLALVAVSAGPY